MGASRSFKAPWDWSMRFSVPLLSLSFGYLIVKDFGDDLYWTFISLSMLVMFIWSNGRIVLGYRVDGSTLYIKRLLWTKRVDLSGLVGAELAPDILKASKPVLSLKMNTWYRVRGYLHETHGRYMAYLMQQKDTVMVQLEDHILVVAPDDPAGFVEAVNRVPSSEFRVPS